MIPSLITMLALIALPVAAEFEVQTVDGRQLVGTLIAIENGRLTLKTAEGRMTLETDSLLQVAPKRMDVATRSNAPPVADRLAAAPTAWIDLGDGSALVARAYTVVAGRAHIVLADGHEVTLPIDEIETVRFRPLTDAVATEWNELLDLPKTDDLLVVGKGATIDYHRGIVGDVDTAVVHFDLDGDLLPIKRAKLLGIIYFRPNGRQRPEATCQVIAKSGTQWSALSLTLGDKLCWTTPSGLSLQRSLASVARIDFSHGKIVMLSDLQPESTRFTPYFGTNDAMPLVAKLHAPRQNRNLEAGPLRLDGKTYTKGIALHSRTKVVYRLPDRFRRLKATVGIDDAVRPSGHVRLVIDGDGRVLFEKEIAGTDPPLSLDLDLTGVRRISILVDFGEQLDVGDHLDICNARIIK